jgi:hypothetical protein
VTVLDWLLDSDPALRWQVLNDLTDAPAEEVAAERARIATEGWGAELLSRQRPDGVFGPIGDGAPDPDAVNMRTVVALRAMGLDPASDAAQTAIGGLRDSEEWLKVLEPGWAWYDRPFFAGETEPCINGRVVAVGAYFGVDVESVVERLIGEQMADGGWNCEQENGSTVGSFHTTINVLEGLLEHEQATGGTPETGAARRRGEAYLLSRRLMRRLSTGQLIRPDFLLFRFPPSWRYDVLRALDYFRLTGERPTDQMGEPIDVVAQKRGTDGRWLLEDRYPDEEILDLRETEGEPNRWNTLRAMRVLRWAERAE